MVGKNNITFFLFLVPIVLSSNLLGQSIIKGPYLQTVTTNSIKIFWETSSSVKGSVNFGLSSTNENSITESQSASMHKVTLTGLEKNTIYKYYVSGPGESSEEYTFKTAGDKITPFKMILYGDNRYSSETSWQNWNNDKILANMEAFNPDILIHTGDLTNNDVAAGWAGFFTGQKNILANTTLFAAKGNHDYSAGMSKYLDTENLFNGSSENFHYVARYNGIQFIFIGSTPTTTEETWIRAAIEQAENDGLYQSIIVRHYPPYNNSRHGNSQSILPIIEDYESIHFVFAGHSHNYQRNYVNGRYYLVSGGAGAGIYSEDNNEPWNQVFEPVKHHVEIMVEGSDMSFKAVDYSGRIIDTFFVKVPVSSTPGKTSTLADRAIFMKVWPNPLTPLTFIRIDNLNLKEKNPKLMVFDINGKMIKDLTHFSFNLGHPSLKTYLWNTAGLNSGVYVIKAIIGNKQITRKLILLK
jgi:predicted phosphodiesterase